jgi:glutaminyl-tRNA synthetase
MSASESNPPSSNFLRTIVESDLASGRHSGVVTRFPPEPNGYPHIGHAKSICLNFGLARDFGGRCHLRMDDTNPTTEDMEYVEALKRDVQWLGFDWGEHLYFASDYFEALYDFAVGLVKSGKAYVCSLSEEETRAARGTVTQAGTASPYRVRTVAENLDLFARMRAGEFKEGEHVLRGRIDMAASNMKMRDPLLYRIRHETHYRRGDDWCIFPMYDFAHCLSDSLEGITHSICTLEFENNRELYDWVVNNCDTVAKPRHYEFARLNLNYTIMSKRKLLQLVKEGHVSGWDDPRMYTLSGLRRRGYTPESIRDFADRIGVAKANSTVDMGILEYCIRDDLHAKSPRVMAVLDPVRVVIENYPEGQEEFLDGPFWPSDHPVQESRKLPFGREIYIERGDFMEEPSKKFYRLAPGQEVRLRYAYFVTCTAVIKNEDGSIREIRCTYDPESRGGSAPDGRKVKGTLHWVSVAHAVMVKVNLYDRLFSDEYPDSVEGGFINALNPDSLETRTIPVEPSLSTAADESQTTRHFQFERQGYFYVDPVDSTPGNPVFNRVVSLKDSWEKVTTPEVVAPKAKVVQQDGASKAEVLESRLSSDPEMAARYASLTSIGIGSEESAALSASGELFDFFQNAQESAGDSQLLGKWIANEMASLLKDCSVAELAFNATEFGSLVGLIHAQKISGKIGKTVLVAMAAGEGDPIQIVKSKNLEQVVDPAILKPIIADLIARHPDQAAQVRGGNARMLGFFVGQVMKKTGGKASPALVNQLLKQGLARQ